MVRPLRILFLFTFSLTAIANIHAQQAQPVEMASLRANQQLRWQRTSPTAQQPDGPVLYQLNFTPGTQGTVAKFDTNTRHLVNSDITDVGSIVAIGSSGFMINATTGIVTFVNAQTFPGTVTSVSNTDGLISITSPTTTPAINLNTTNTDARYVRKSGDTMTGALNLPTNGLVAGSNQLVLSGGKVGIGTNGPNAELQVIGAAGVSSVGGGAGTAGDPGLNVQGGAGGAVIAGVGPSGPGGSPTIAGGAGGTTFNGPGGGGGSVTMTGGAGGSITATAGGFTAGAGGSITLAAGAGGTAGAGNNPGAGGNVLIEPGSGTPSGNVLIADVGGNVGVGTTSPSQKLEVAGNIALSGRISLGIYVKTDTPSTAVWDEACSNANDVAISGGGFGVGGTVLRESRPTVTLSPGQTGNPSNSWRVTCSNGGSDAICSQAYVMCLSHASP
ncbi:MAG TPA: hypothetical protein VK699_08485 [Terriglobales bacterium]|jgi:hypothetical protein|nr:hypothetical protein [Terriglobales bacterium]